MASICSTGGVRGGADLRVHVVFRLLSHECALIDCGAFDKIDLLASSVACDKCAVNPCFAAMI
jgi:hypothetical protein